MPLSVGRVSRWVACSVCRGWPRARQSFPLSRGPMKDSAEGVLNEVEIACFSWVGPYPRARQRWNALLEASAGRPRVRQRSLCGFEEAPDGSYRGAGPWAEYIGPHGSPERIRVLWESWRSSMVSGCRATTELSSLVASATSSSPGSLSSSPFSPSDRRKTVCLGSL